MLHSVRGRLLDSQDWLLGAIQDGPEAGILADPVTLTLIHVWDLMLQSAQLCFSCQLLYLEAELIN